MNTLGKQSKTDVWNGNMALWWSVVATFLLKMSAGQQVDHILRQSTSCQKDTPSGDFGFYFDGDEIFYVDLDIKEVEYKLPEFQKFFFFEAQLGLQALSACHFNLDIYIKRSKGISGPKVPPKVKLYPSRPVELGKSSTLICHADGFFPSVLNISWSKNGTPLEEGITITDFYPGKEFTFERFSYLTSIPDGGDIYSCTVEHPALDQPNAVFWQAEKTFVHENGTVSLSIHKKLKVIPRITVHPQRNVVEKHPNLLMCVTSGFYPQRIRVTMLKNGEEVTHDISSSGVVSNGNWTYQITLLIEFIPKKEDVYGCKVEHSSLKEPVIVEWRMEAYN
ncbi:RLA class II histocompatibility antigen, DP alpha-1 chain-like isoform X2 [Protopterus annectens]|uniref:RLA class II histocompatibility antigen, DP alpha-1 chain-like isoform X2 n=1 Tax=Protopterus annectens TaxID=7888 RepID=UPI001CFB30B2|nr:RLA class II histocompatibility antigen, DP alpha-1 chain-like isoform X2 [Protopterus annectens]